MTDEQESEEEVEFEERLEATASRLETMDLQAHVKPPREKATGDEASSGASATLAGRALDRLLKLVGIDRH